MPFPLKTKTEGTSECGVATPFRNHEIEWVMLISVLLYMEICEAFLEFKRPLRAVNL